MTDKRIDFIANHLSLEGRSIYLAMIPSYISGYADYVFQTAKVDVQRRRIKNLDKNFRRLLTEPYFYLQAMSQDSAEKIASWNYPSPYDFYDMRADEEDLAELLSQEHRKDSYFEVIRNGSLFGYAVFVQAEDGLEIGLGMEPSQTGQGMGADFYQAIEEFAKANYSFQQLSLSVAAFNSRAQALYQKQGYQPVKHYLQVTNGGHYPFIKMIKNMKE